MLLCSSNQGNGYRVVEGNHWLGLSEPTRHFFCIIPQSNGFTILQELIKWEESSDPKVISKEKTKHPTKLVAVKVLYIGTLILFATFLRKP